MLTWMSWRGPTRSGSYRTCRRAQAGYTAWLTQIGVSCLIPEALPREASGRRCPAATTPRSRLTSALLVSSDTLASSTPCVLRSAASTAEEQDVQTMPPMASGRVAASPLPREEQAKPQSSTADASWACQMQRAGVCVAQTVASKSLEWRAAGSSHDAAAAGLQGASICMHADLPHPAAEGRTPLWPPAAHKGLHGTISIPTCCCPCAIGVAWQGEAPMHIWLLQPHAGTALACSVSDTAACATPGRPASALSTAPEQDEQVMPSMRNLK